MIVHPSAGVTDPYGPAASELLQPLQADLAAMARDAVDQFYAVLRDAGRTPCVVAGLSAAELDQLQAREADHIAALLSADLDRATHVRRAQNAGAVHRLTGVGLDALIEAYAFYQERICWLLQERVPQAETRELLLRLTMQRLLQDLQGQVRRYAAINSASAAAFADLNRHVMAAENLADLVRGALEIIGALPGSVCAFFARVDEGGELQVEQSYGAAAEAYHHAMESGEVPRLSVDPALLAGQGPGGRAWRSGEIIVSDAWMLEPDKAPWREVGARLGFHSSAAVPLIDEHGRSIALLSLYSTWPGLFSAAQMQGLLSHAQLLLSGAVQRRMSAAVVPLRKQRAYRRLLGERRVIFAYQPIIDLRDGALIKLEALARLRGADGEEIAPQRFLPALGADELLTLFESGLEQICEDARRLHGQSIDATMSINFPAAGFTDPRYEKSIFAILQRFDLAASRVQLELLETQDGGEWTPARQEVIQRLRSAGVQIAQDDLGSGHSSLLRMDQYPFDEVKIDAGLVRGALHNPKRAVDFMLYLTRLAHAFNIPVTVEGLEHPGIIEAAAIVGADRGQGYGIARPMPVTQLGAWRERYRYDIDAGRPRTAIGAMAAYLLWDLQIAAIADRPELIAQFVGARAIVDEFIRVNHLEGSAVARLLARNQELAALFDSASRETAAVRTQLLDELTRRWLEEVRRSHIGASG